MSLQEIKVFFDDQNNDYLKEKLYQQKDIIKDQINILNTRTKAIKRTLNSIEQYENSPSIGNLIIEYIPKRFIFLNTTSENFYQTGIETYEKELIILKERLINLNYDNFYHNNAGSMIDKTNFLEGKFISSNVFVKIDEDDFKTTDISHINPGMFLCIYCDNFDNELEYCEIILEEIKSKNYEVCGDYICETLYELGMSNDQQRGMFLRLQIPIKHKNK